MGAKVYELGILGPTYTLIHSSTHTPFEWKLNA